MSIETQLDDARLANATLREKLRQVIEERDEAVDRADKAEAKTGRLKRGIRYGILTLEGAGELVGKAIDLLMGDEERFDEAMKMLCRVAGRTPVEVDIRSCTVRDLAQGDSPTEFEPGNTEIEGDK